MRRASALALIACGLAASGSLARAQEARIELTALAGLRGGATLTPDAVGETKTEADPSPAWGLGVDLPLGERTAVELFLERQELGFDTDPEFELAVDYLHAGGVYEPRTRRVRPFVAAALGLTRFSASGAAADDSIELSGSLGGGVKIPFGSRFALRLEARGYATFGDAAFAVACGPGCSATLAADGWYQLAGRIGLTIGL